MAEKQNVKPLIDAALAAGLPVSGFINSSNPERRRFWYSRAITQEEQEAAQALIDEYDYDTPFEES